MNNNRFNKHKLYRESIYNNNHWWHGWKSLGLSDYTIQYIVKYFDNLESFLVNNSYKDATHNNINKLNSVYWNTLLTNLTNNIKSNYNEIIIPANELKNILNLSMSSWFSINKENPYIVINYEYLVHKDGYDKLKNLIDNINSLKLMDSNNQVNIKEKNNNIKEPLYDLINNIKPKYYVMPKNRKSNWLPILLLTSFIFFFISCIIFLILCFI